MRKPPRATSATALVTTSPLVPVTASFLCWGAGVGVVEGVGSSYRSITGVGSGTGRLVVGLGVGVGITDGVVLGLGVGVDGVVDGLGADEVGLGAGVGFVDGVGVGTGGVLGVGTGLGSGVGAGVGVLSNPALPPDSFLTTLVATSQDLSWEVIPAESVHGPGSVELTLMFSSNRAFSPLSNLTLRTALSLAQLTTLASMKRMYWGCPQVLASVYTPILPAKSWSQTNF